MGMDGSVKDLRLDVWNYFHFNVPVCHSCKKIASRYVILSYRVDRLKQFEMRYLCLCELCYSDFVDFNKP